MQIRIRVGAARDGSFDQVFKSIVSAAKEANAKVVAEESKSISVQDQLQKKHVALQEQLLKHRWAQEREILRAQITETKAVHDRIHQLSVQSAKSKQEIQKASSAAAAAKDLAIAKESAERITAIEVAQAKEAARQKREIAVNEAKAALRIQTQTAGGGGGRRTGRDMAYRMGYWASRNLSPVTPMLSYAGRIGSDLVHGAGVDFNFGSMVGKQVGLEKLYAELAGQAYQEGKPGAKGVRQDAGALQSEGMAIAKQFGFDPEQVARATTKFVDLTGNLEMARAAMGGLARLSNATASDLTEMSSAAAAVSVQLDKAMGDDTQGKVRALQGIMRTFAGEGKEGAVEIKDLAAQMPKIAAVAARFEGGPEKVFESLGVLAQESRKAGGSASASQAATSVARFADLTSNKKGAERFAALGISLFTDKGKTQIRDPQEIILEALSKTKGSLPAISDLFKNVMANRAIQGFTNVYNTTKGTDQEKLKAVAKEWTDIASARLSEKQEIENNAKVMQTAAKKAQVFQDELQEIASKLATKLLPAMEQLAPIALKAADAFGGVVGWLADNPFAVIPAAKAAAVGKAGVEQTIRAGVENLFRNFTGGGGPGGAGGAAGAIGLGGSLAAGLTIAAAAITITEVGMMTIDKVMDQEAGKQKKAISQEIAATNAESDYNAALRDYNSGVASGAPTPEAAKNLGDARGALKAAAENLKPEEGPGFIKTFLEGLVMGTSSGGATLPGEAGFRAPSTATSTEADAEQKRRHDETMRVQEEQRRLLAKIAEGLSSGALPPGIDNSSRTPASLNP